MKIHGFSDPKYTYVLQNCKHKILRPKPILPYMTKNVQTSKLARISTLVSFGLLVMLGLTSRSKENEPNDNNLTRVEKQNLGYLANDIYTKECMNGALKFASQDSKAVNGVADFLNEFVIQQRNKLNLQKNVEDYDRFNILDFNKNW